MKTDMLSPVHSPTDTNHQINQTLYPRIVFFGMAVVFLFIHFYVARRITNLYETFDVTTPATARYAALIASGISFSIGLFSFRKDEHYPQPNEIRKSQQNLLMHRPFVMAVLGILAAFVVYSIIAPMYSLTTQLQP